MNKTDGKTIFVCGRNERKIKPDETAHRSATVRRFSKWRGCDVCVRRQYIFGLRSRKGNFVQPSYKHTDGKSIMCGTRLSVRGGLVCGTRVYARFLGVKFKLSNIHILYMSVPLKTLSNIQIVQIFAEGKHTSQGTVNI